MSGLEWIIAAAIVWWVVRGLGADLRVLSRGRVPERVAAGRARAAAGGGRYGLRSYGRDLWSDSWQIARAKREARVAQRLDHIREHGPGPTWRQKASDRMSAAWGRWETRMSHRWQQRQARDGQPEPEPVAPATAERDQPDEELQGDARRSGQDQPEQTEQRREPVEPVEPVTPTPYNPDQQKDPQELTAVRGPDGRW